ALPISAAANKLLAIIENAEYILSIEWMAATQAHDFIQSVAARAPGTDALYGLLRTHVAPYSDDRPPSADIEAIRSLMSQNTPPN
ncbi:histidine ammonia-lyase, partial [Mesorhizobium sp. M2D.F.Ca.ET.232.01.1.1]|uniref:aromatic amino acid lyase n=1 Tax=Mesorhizobium sp. M2D.F.Ca.ET.232.01.1.1 TaxID=2496670 RepID=UPI00113D3CC6